MSQLNATAATPRRSSRLSQTGSVAQSGITTLTNGGTRTKKRGPLAKITARKSNTYGSSGRSGHAETLAVHNTSFAQAFQNQRVDAVAREGDDDEEDDDFDELGEDSHMMSGGLSGFPTNRSPSVETDAQTPRPNGSLFERSDAGSMSDGDFPTSAGDTSKSFGLNHEAGMLGYQRYDREESPGPWKAPLWQQNRDRKRREQEQEQGLADYEDEDDQAENEVQPVPQAILKQGLAKKTPATPAEKANNVTSGLAQKSRATPAEKVAIKKAVNTLVVEEQERVVRSGPRVQPANGPPAAAQWNGNVNSGAHHLPDLPWKKYALHTLYILFGGFVLSQVLALVMSSSFPESQPRTPSVATAMADRVAYSWGKVAEFIQPHRMTEHEEVEAFKAGDDNIMWNRLYKLNKKFDAKFDTMNSTIKDFRDQLPEFMIIRRHNDGRREITDDFWHALIEKAQHNDNDPAWIQYLKSNEQKLRDFFGVPIDTSHSTHWPEAVSRQEFVDTMAQHYKSLSSVVDTRIYETIQGQSSQIKAIAKEEARVAIVDSIRLQSLAQSNILANYELTFRKANYFSSGLGAMVEPELTSTTFLDNPQWHSRIARRLARVPLRNPPKAALEKWEEPGDCWCAAPNPSMKGQAQLTIALTDGVYPQQITIEHLPKEMMPGKKITNAPRTMEFWVETTEPPQYQYAHREDACGQGPEGWTCLGAFTYNIHASNHQQTFDLDAHSTVPVTKAMVRVTSNWGADHTCLYRVRLHGKDAVEEYHYEVRMGDPV